MQSPERANIFIPCGFLCRTRPQGRIPTESQNSETAWALRAYLEQELQPAFSQLDFRHQIDRISTERAPIFSPTP